MSGILFGGNSSQSRNFVPLIIFNGESNSGGYALNSELTTAQKLPRSAVQIFNNTTLVFEDLHIGVNNLIDHAGLPANETHGWEEGLATAVEDGLFTGFDQIYLLKTGQGGSIISQWNIGGAYLNTYIARVQAAKALILNTGKIPLPFIWYSQGLNDNVAGTNPTTWKANTIAHFKNLRQYIGYAPIIEPQFMTGQGSYNTYLSDIQVTEKYFFTVSSTGAGLRDSLHWNAQGMALLASRMADVSINTIGIDFENYTLTSDLALGGSAPTTRVTNLIAAPSISVQPSNQSAFEGGTATFSITATGSPFPTYQWQKQESGAGAFSNISGATSSSYTTGTLTVASDNGDVYRCVVTNSEGSVTSNSATLTVTIPLSLSPVNWVTLSGATNGSPSAGFISSSGSGTGGTSDRSVDATQPFFYVFDLNDATNSATIVICLHETSGAAYAWNSSNVYVSGMYSFGGDLYRSFQGDSGTLAADIPSFPCKIKAEKSGNDVVYSTSVDNGVSWSVFDTHVGVLSGKTTLYIKAIFAIAGATKSIKVNQS